MTKTTRYGLIIAGLCTFFIVAPVLVLYVQGKALNFRDKNTELTGIISIKTSPASADVVVGDQPPVKAPKAIRFLKSGDYSITVSKTGYKTWHKTLNVIAGKVTYANPNPYPLHLLKDSQPVKLIENISSYVHLNDNILYATENLLVLLKTTNNESITSKTPAKISNLIPDKYSANVLVTGTQFTGVINTENMQFLDFTKITQDSITTSVANNWLWHISKSGTLQGVQLIKPNKTYTFATNVNCFLVQDEDLYYLTSNSDNTQTLHHGTISGTELAQDQVLAKGIPNTEKNTILLDSRKAVYILLDSNLWRVNNNLELIEENVQNVTTDSGSLVYTKPGELWWYESGSDKTHLVTRSTDNFSSFYVNPALDYAFFTEGNKIVALELDERSGQNRYDLVSSQEPINNISVPSLTDILFRLGKDLYSLPVFDN